MNKYQFEKTDRNFYMNVLMVSEYLHVAKSTIYKWVGENYIPHKKLGKRVIFIKNDIDQWVLNNGTIIEDLPELPKFSSRIKDFPEETQNSAKNLNPHPSLGSGSKYRRAS